MALTNQELKRLARAGAQARLVELEAERKAILQAFPDLEGGSAAKAPTRRKRRKMTAAEKTAVGERMKKYWAARRAKRVAKK